MTANSQTNRKLFYAKDLILYFVAVFIIVGLFLAFVVIPKFSTSFTGFKVTINNEVILSYTFDGEIYLSPSHSKNIEYSIDGDIFTAIISSDIHKDGYNVIKIDKTKKTASITESNCSNSKDCVYSPTISFKGAIYCAPHALKITAIGGSDFIPPSVG